MDKKLAFFSLFVFIFIFSLFFSVKISLAVGNCYDACLGFMVNHYSNIGCSPFPKINNDVCYYGCVNKGIVSDVPSGYTCICYNSQPCAGSDVQCLNTGCKTLKTAATPSTQQNGTAGATCPEGQICNPLKYGNFEDLLDAVINFIFRIGVIGIAPVMLIIGGLLYVTSGGSPERTRTAGKLVLYTLIGVAIILLAKGLILVLGSILGVPK